MYIKSFTLKNFVLRWTIGPTLQMGKKQGPGLNLQQIGGFIFQKIHFENVLFWPAASIWRDSGTLVHTHPECVKWDHRPELNTRWVEGGMGDEVPSQLGLFRKVTGEKRGDHVS